MDSRRKSSVLKKGLVVFFVISILAVACILIWTTKKDTWVQVSHFRLIFLPLILGLSVLRWYLDGMTLRCMADPQSPSTLDIGRATVIRLEGNMVANVLPVFLGILSTHAYLLHKEKMSWSESTAVSMMRAVLPVFLFLGTLPVLSFMRLDIHSGKFFQKFIQVVSFPVLAIVVVAAITFFFLREIKTAVSVLFRWSRKVKIIRADKMLVVAEKLFEGINRFSHVFWSYLRGKKRLLFRMGFWILATFVADSFVALAILWGLGYTAPFWNALAILFLLWPVAYLAPVPGGAGVLEVSYLGFFSLFMPKDMTGMAVLLWRLFLTYLPAAAGIYYLVLEFKNDPKLGRLLQHRVKASKRKPRRKPGPSNPTTVFK